MISIDFATGNHRLAARITTGLAAAALLLVVLAVGTLLHARSLHGAYADLEARRGTLESSMHRLDAVLAERDRVVKDLTALSGLLQERRFSWTLLLTDLEAVFPVGVALDKLGVEAGGRRVVLAGRARSPEALRNLMVGLERSPHFTDPFLKHQSIDKGAISFDLTASYEESRTAATTPRP